MPNTEEPSTFDHYQIRQGQHYCDQNAFINVEYKELRFIGKLDNTKCQAYNRKSGQSI